MTPLPMASLYELELLYLPWGNAIRKVLRKAVEEIPKGARVVDLMCGPGQLLGFLHTLRPDLQLKGVDLSEHFIAHAKAKYQGVEFEVAHVLRWLQECEEEFDAVICTAGMHHLPFDKQETLVQMVSKQLVSGGLFISAEPYIDSFGNEDERRVSATRAGTAHLFAVLEKDPPPDIIDIALNILRNDLLLDGEFKDSFQKVFAFIRKHFEVLSHECTWKAQDTVEAGEYVVVAVKK